jgi:hypothetical protein
VHSVSANAVDIAKISKCLEAFRADFISHCGAMIGTTYKPDAKLTIDSAYTVGHAAYSLWALVGYLDYQKTVRSTQHAGAGIASLTQHCCILLLLNSMHAA